MVKIILVIKGDPTLPLESTRTLFQGEPRIIGRTDQVSVYEIEADGIRSPDKLVEFYLDRYGTNVEIYCPLIHARPGGLY